MSLFTFYLAKQQTEEMNEKNLRKGIASAKIGAKIMGYTLENIIDNGLFSLAQVFDYSLAPIDLPKYITEKYTDVSEKNLNAVRKYHYSTTLDSYLDNAIVSIQDEFLADSQIVYAVLIDVNGYVPTHNSIYNRPLTGNFINDRSWSRTKRIYNDKIGLNAAQNAGQSYLQQIYKQDTGKVFWDISSPVFVKGKRWGAFRVGFSMQDTENAMAELRRKVVIMMAILLVVSVIFINRITESMMKPLDQLHQGVNKVAKGDLNFNQIIKSNDEIGDLAKAFKKMTLDLTHYIKDLEETTKAKERIQSELMIARQIQTSMLPRIFPAFPNRKEFDIYAIMDPAKEVGGDLYDFFLIDDNNLCFIIGDVSGKGVPAALFMVICKMLLKREIMRGIPISEALANVNNILYPDNETCMFATVLCCGLNIKS